MNSYANMIFSAFFSWLKSVIQMIYSAVMQPDHWSLLTFIANNWILLLVILLVVGTVIDLTVYFFRWRPFEVWRSFFRRQRRRGKPRTRVTGQQAASALPTVGTVPEDDAYVIPDSGLQRSPESLIYMDPMTDVEYSSSGEMSGDSEDPSVLQEAVGGGADDALASEQQDEHRRRRHIRPKGKKGGLRQLIRTILAEDEPEADPLRYTAAPPPVNARDAYGDPYIPPQWKKPEHMTIRKKRSEREKQDD